MKINKHHIFTIIRIFASAIILYFLYTFFMSFFKNKEITTNSIVVPQTLKKEPKQSLTDSELDLNWEILSHSIALVQIFKQDNFYDICLDEKAASQMRTKLLKNRKEAKESSREINGSNYKELISENFICLTYENTNKIIHTNCGATFNEKRIIKPSEGIFKYVEEGKFFTPQSLLPDTALYITSAELNEDNKLVLKFAAIKRWAQLFQEIFQKNQHLSSSLKLEFKVDEKNSTNEITRGELRF